MLFRIAICCCNYLYGEGIKQLIEQDGLDIDTAINCSDNCSDPEEINEIKPDLVINERLLDLVSKGLVGILPTMTNYSQFKRAIKSVIAGEFWFERRKLQDIVSNMNSIVAKKRLLLNRTETVIVKMVCRGYSNKEITEKLKVTEQYVKSHLNRIYKKTVASDIYSLQSMP